VFVTFFNRHGPLTIGYGSKEHATHEPLISRAMLAEVPLTGLPFLFALLTQFHGEGWR